MARHAAISDGSMRMKGNALPWLLISLIVVISDQLTKMLVVQNLSVHAAIEVISGLLNWNLAYNTGAAFSFLADQDGWQRWILSLLAVIVSLALSIWLWRIPRGDWRTALPLALIIGGAVGNLIDRIRLGKVIDFIQVYYQDWFWPSFNIADSAISIGAILLLWFGLRAQRSQT